MPELPEVETVCRLMRRVLVGHVITSVEVVPDSIVFGAAPSEAIVNALRGRAVTSIGRKGKVWWVETESTPVLFGHLGMSGWIRELGAPTIRLKEHGNAPLDDEKDQPRFLKLLISTSEAQLAFTDPRRLGRIWLGASADVDFRVKRLGPDALVALPSGQKFQALFAKRRAPIKASLMDQTILSGIGNWVADEVLYHARIAPGRLGTTLTPPEFARLRRAITFVLSVAVDLGADDARYPTDWLFHHRWGGSRGHVKLGHYEIVREQVGGRTTAWIPALQS